MNMQNLTKEVGQLDLLINAVSSEIAEHVSSNGYDKVFSEMQEALDELRLSRGVRLMLFNAYDRRVNRYATRTANNHSQRRVYSSFRRAS
ncbi:MAG: hypothetical protein WBV94_31760 [Blastocatellia bacterium]